MTEFAVKLDIVEPSMLTKFVNTLISNIACLNLTHENSNNSEKQVSPLCELFKTVGSVDRAVYILSEKLVNDESFNNACLRYKITIDDEEGIGYDEDRLDELKQFIFDTFINHFGLFGIHNVDYDHVHGYVYDFIHLVTHKDNKFLYEFNYVENNELSPCAKLVSAIALKLACDENIDHRNECVDEHLTSALCDAITENGSFDKAVTQISNSTIENSEFTSLLHSFREICSNLNIEEVNIDDIINNIFDVTASKRYFENVEINEEIEDEFMEISENLCNKFIEDNGLFEVLSLHGDEISFIQDNIKMFLLFF